MFQLGAGATLEWTEAWSALSVDPSAVAADVAYADAVAAGEAALDATPGMATADFLAVDARMRSLSDAPLVAAADGGALAHGTAWGRVHETLLAWARGGAPTPYRAGLRFDAPITPAERPFLELLGAGGGPAAGGRPVGTPLAGGAVGTFSAASLSRLAPTGFMVDAAWVPVLQKSAAAHGATWLHHLHLGVALKQLDGPGAAAAAAAHFNASWALNLNALALLLSGKTDAAWSAALAGIAQACGNAGNAGGGSTESTCTDATDLARDVGTAALNAARAAADWNTVARTLRDVDDGPMPADVKARLLGCQAFRVAAIAMAVYGNPLRSLEPDPAVAVALLQRGPWSGCERGSTGALMELWSAAHYALEAKARGVASLDALGQLVVRQQHPPPRSIDFAGAD